MIRKTSIGPWQQGTNAGRYDDGGNGGLPSSPANREDTDATVGNNQGNATAADVDRGNADAGTSSVLLAANTPDHNNNAKGNDADAEDAVGKKTLMRDVTVALTGAGALALAVILTLHNDDIGGGWYNSTLVLSVAPHSCNDDKLPQHHRPPLVHMWMMMAPQRCW